MIAWTLGNAHHPVPMLFQSDLNIEYAAAASGITMRGCVVSAVDLFNFLKIFILED